MSEMKKIFNTLFVKTFFFSISKISYGFKNKDEQRFGKLYLENSYLFGI